MKKSLYVLIVLLYFIHSAAFSAFAASDTLKYSVDFAPEGIYYAETDKSIRITGWAFDRSGETVRCFYVIDNGASVYTDPVVRNDVRSAFPECAQADCGFNQFISLDGIAAGMHTFKFYAQFGGETKLISQTEFEARKIIKDCNTAPSGEYDADETSFLNVCGWAFSSWGENTDCYYQIDDFPAVLLQKTKRADVTAYYEICAQEYCGFNSNLPVSEFTLGEHTLTLFALCGDKKAVISKTDIKIISSSFDIKFSNDSYLSGEYNSETTQSIQISGWAFNKNGLETRCFYQFDDLEKHPLEKITRNDVKTVFPECAQTDCGYKAEISIEGLAKGKHIYRVYALSANVLQIIKESEFTVISSEGVLKLNSDFAPDKEYDLGESAYVNIQGWGYNTSASAVKFYAKFDSGDYFYITSENRPDVFNSLDDCYTLECGYKQQIFIGNLPDGDHTFTVKIVSAEMSKTLTSNFSIVRPDYSVTFDLCGGSGNIPAFSKTYGKNELLPQTIPVKPYYEFCGWSTLPDGSGVKYNCGEEFRQNENTVLYAVWERDSFAPEEDSGIAVDLKNSLIYGIDPQNNDSSAVKSKFKNTNIIIDSEKTVTSTRISLYDSGVCYLCAQAVILGDVDCDGRIDARDAVIAECIGAEISETTDTAVLNAADCARDGYINADDISLMLGEGLFTSSVDFSSVTSRGFFDTDFTVKEAADAQPGSFVLNGEDTGTTAKTSGKKISYYVDSDCPDFNFFAVRYTSPAYLKGTLTYIADNSLYSENFFLEPSAEKSDFYSFIDGVFDGVRSSRLVSLEFEPIDSDDSDIVLYGFSVFNRAVPERVTFISNEQIKIGVNLEWGGALSYFEDLDSDVEAVSDNGIIRIDSNASQRYDSEILSQSVNLINCHDAGRLVQQSYYGTTNYEMGYFNGHYVAYNPVQGGNMYNDSSKIVDVRAQGETLYVKCRPLDWAKEKEYITDSYMEATYTICDETLKTQCRFVDFSGYDPAQTGQELPAFYSAATLDRFVYYGGENPWSDGELSEATGLDEYLYARYPTFESTENWGALTGEFDDSFSIGLYIPDVTIIAAGVFGSLTDQNENPDTSSSTSYLSGVRSILFKSFDPIEYDFYITTGTVNSIRETFRSISQN